MAWGQNVNSATNVPADLTNAVAIAAGGSHNLAVRSTGVLTNWGQDIGPMPPSLTNVAAIAAGSNFNLALKPDGTVVAWGVNDRHQTNVPQNLTIVEAISAGDLHSLALKSDGTVVSWGDNSCGQTNVPLDLTNAMAVAAGAGFSMALRNDGTVVAWGDNSLGQTNAPAGLSGVKSVAAGGAHALAALFSPLVQYPVDVTKDLLLVYNSSSQDSSNLCAYYIAHRPLVSAANVLPIACDSTESTTMSNCDALIISPVLDWLKIHPTKHPGHLVLFYGIPTRVQDGDYQYGGVSFHVYSSYPGLRPFVMNINAATLADCKAYVDKLEQFGSNYCPGKLVISPNAREYSSTNYILDNVRHGPGYPMDYSGSGYVVAMATNALLANGVSQAAMMYADGVEIKSNGILYNLAHVTSATNVAGYICWGQHSSLGQTYGNDGTVRWFGDSRWWIIETVESFNGQVSQVSPMGSFTQWFASSAFGGASYSSTPVGAVTHVEEPGLGGVENSAAFFGLWALGKPFCICAWNSKNTTYFQAVGDPFVASK